MNRHSRAVAAALLLAISAGCFGGFNLTRKLWGFNNTVSPNKFLKELVFVALVLVPVYEVLALGDALIFNTIEFWSGQNPIMVMNDGPRQVIARRTVDGVRIEVSEPGKPARVVDVAVSEEGTSARLDDGTLLAAVASDEGGATLRDASGRVLLQRSEAQLAEAAQSPRQVLARLLEQDPAMLIAR